MARQKEGRVKWTEAIWLFTKGAIYTISITTFVVWLFCWVAYQVYK